MTQMVVAENELVLRNRRHHLRPHYRRYRNLDVDTVLFAIGDKHDPAIGLPMGPDGYATSPNAGGPKPANPKQPHSKSGYRRCQPRPGQFVVGWARKASTGLAGLARHDGELGARQALEYFQAAPDTNTASEGEIRSRLDSQTVSDRGKAGPDTARSALKPAKDKSHRPTHSISTRRANIQTIDEEKDSSSSPTRHIQPGCPLRAAIRTAHVVRAGAGGQVSEGSLSEIPNRKITPITQL